MTRPKNALDADGGFASMLRPWLLPVFDTILVTEANPEAGHAAAQAAVDAAASLPARQRTLEVIYEPGSYPSVWGGQAYVHSQGLDPATVVIESDAEGGGVHHAFDGPSWHEGLTLRSLGSGPKYPLHVTGGGAIVWSDCRFETPGTSAGGPALVGLDGGPGLSLHFYRCTFRNEGGAPFNIHGAATNGPHDRLDIAFVDCVAEGPTGRQVTYNSLNTVSQDTLWLSGGNLERGTLDGASWGSTGLWPVPVAGLDARARVALFGADGGA